MAECRKCRSAIRGETGIRCDGICDKVYHFTKKCAGIDQYSGNIMSENNFIRFICDDCIMYIQNVDLVLKGIQDSVDKNKRILVEYKDDFEKSLQKNEMEIKTLLETIEKKYTERFIKMENLQKLCETNVQEVKSMCENFNEIENQNKNICESIEKNNGKICSEIKKIVKETNNKTKMSYSQTVANNAVMPDLSNNVPLIIKPKEKQSAEITKAELNNKVDPVNFKITKVENRRNGTVVIQSENIVEREKIKKAIQNEISDKYEIKVPNEISMQIIVTDMSFKIPEKDLVEKLKKQNEDLKNSEIEIIKMFETKRYNKTVYNAKVKIDNDSYKKVILAQRLNVGWERCRAFDGTRVMQCYKCLGYNHKSSECRNEEICYKCHGNHKATQCNKEIINKCVNCIKENKRLNLELDENHATNDRECPVYQNKLNIKKKRIGLNV